MASEPRTSTPWSDDVLARTVAALEAVADPGRAVGMAGYMRDQFAFLGVDTPTRRAVQRDVLAATGVPDQADLLAFADAAWQHPARELQYAGVDLLRRHARRLDPSALPALERLVVTKAWWDTVDGLAPHAVGAIVRRHPEQAVVMDDWIGRDDQWLVRTALLHQLLWKGDTDAERLLRYCRQRAADPRFFVRKAIGWALRQHARTDPDGVWAFVDAHRAELSPLSVREAEKHRPPVDAPPG